MPGNLSNFFFCHTFQFVTLLVLSRPFGFPKQPSIHGLLISVSFNIWKGNRTVSQEEPDQNEGRFLASGLGPCGFLRPSQRRRVDRLGLRQRAGRHGHGPRHVLRPVVSSLIHLKIRFDCSIHYGGPI